MKTTNLFFVIATTFALAGCDGSLDGPSASTVSRSNLKLPLTPLQVVEATPGPY